MDRTYPIYIPSSERHFPNIKKRESIKKSKGWGVLLFLSENEEANQMEIIKVVVTEWHRAEEMRRTGKIGSCNIPHTHTSIEKISDRGEAEGVASSYLISSHASASNKSLPLKTHYMALSTAKRHYKITKWDLNKMAKEHPHSHVHYLTWDAEESKYIERNYYRKSICDYYFGENK